MLSEYWRTLQCDLFPWLEEELGPLGEPHRRFVTVIETGRLEAFVAQWSGLPGRPQKDRAALARAIPAARRPVRHPARKASPRRSKCGQKGKF